MSDQHPEAGAEHGQGQAGERDDTHKFGVEKLQFADARVIARDGARR